MPLTHAAALGLAYAGLMVTSWAVVRRGKIPSAAPDREGWEPYIPSVFRYREVVRQLGHKPTLYVMRKREGGKRLYRACTSQEFSQIETDHCVTF